MTRALRTDALENRRRLLAAAREAFAGVQDADSVSLQGIAQAAGVGQGTLYRHFRTREDLLLAVYEADVELLVQSASELLDRHPPREALFAWLLSLAAYGIVKRSLGQVVQAETGTALSDRWRPPVLDALERLLAAGREAGVVRTDVNAAGVWRLCSFVWGPDPAPGRSGTAVPELLQVVMDGLAVANPGELNRTHAGVVRDAAPGSVRGLAR